MVIKRIGFYSCDYDLVPLDWVAAKTKMMPDEFITPEGNDVTDAFRMYLRPLLGSKMPDAYRLRAPFMKKILNKGVAQSERQPGLPSW